MARFDAHGRFDAVLVGRQLGREPREPWRVAARCGRGYPMVIASPSRLADGTPFPTLYWLTCPTLAAMAAAEESAGASAYWRSQVESDRALQEQVLAADAALRAAREQESDGVDACSTVGIAGQSDPESMKCLHARVALALAGIDDPIGVRIVSQSVDAGLMHRDAKGTLSCPEHHCRELAIIDDASAGGIDARH